MINFYLLKDKKQMPSISKLKGMEYVGSIDYEVYLNLQAKNIIAERYDYFSNFRWGTEVIKQIKENTSQEKYKDDTDVIQLNNILDKALEEKSGLFALGD